MGCWICVRISPAESVRTGKMEAERRVFHAGRAQRSWLISDVLRNVEAAALHHESTVVGFSAEEFSTKNRQNLKANPPCLPEKRCFSLVVCVRWLTLSPVPGPAGLSVLILPVEASLEAESGCLLFQTASEEPLRVPVLYICSSAHSRVDSCRSVHVGGG